MSAVIEKVDTELDRKVELMKEFASSEYYHGYLGPKLGIALLGMAGGRSHEWILLSGRRPTERRFKIDLRDETITDDDGKVVLGLDIQNYNSLVKCMFEAIGALTSLAAKVDAEYRDTKQVYELRRPGVALVYMRSLCSAQDRYVYCSANAGGYTVTLYYPDEQQLLSLNFTLAVSSTKSITIKVSTATGSPVCTFTVPSSATIEDAGNIDKFLRSCRRTSIKRPIV